MNIAELFVNLGIKGSEKTLAAITGVRKGLNETASMSLEAKAGIVAAMYALERLFAASGAQGTNLTNFNALLGTSTKILQQYQYAGRQVGISNQEMEGTFKSLSSVFTKTLIGEGAPKGLERVRNLVGGFSQRDLENYVLHPEQAFQKFQEYARRESNKGLRNETLRSFGLGDSMIAGLDRDGFRPGVLNRAPTYGPTELRSLDLANIAWSNLGTKIEMAVGHFNARHGLQLVSDISHITDQVVKLAEAFTRLAETLKFFKLIGMIFDGWAKLFNLTTKGVDAVTGAVNDPKKGAQLGNDIGSFFKEMPSVFKAMFNDISPETREKLKNILYRGPDSSFAPNVPAGLGAGGAQTADVNINMNFQHDGKDHQKTAESVKKAIQDSYRQMSAQGQGS